jgi:RNA polymerase sigma-70 factor (ECF subfamily)
MPTFGSGPYKSPGALAHFDTTHWSVVLAAGHSSSPDAQEALEKLCRGYWYPLYAFVRRQGCSPPDAQDLTQEFFARLLEKKYLAMANRNRGKFRWFLLSSFKHFLANEWDRARAQKRGGGKTHLPFDDLAGEKLYALESAHELAPDRIYERTWALTLLEQARNRLRQEYTTLGKEARFDHLELFLPGEKSAISYASAAHNLGLTEGAVKAEVHRLKKRYRELVRSEIAQTVSTASEIDEELRQLIAALS